MKIAVINFSGNVGKTTVAKQLLAPRLKAQEYTVETINAGASDHDVSSERIKGSQFSGLHDTLMRMDSAIVDIGASNVEEFLKQMTQFAGSHEEFDYFVVPVVAEKKQQTDTVNTINTLNSLGVPAQKIRVLFNKVDADDVDNLESIFPVVLGYIEVEKKAVYRPGSVIHANALFDRLRALEKGVSELMADETDYRANLKQATSEDDKQMAVSMISAKRLAVSAHRNLDDAYQALFT